MWHSTREQCVISRSEHTSSCLVGSAVVQQRTTGSQDTQHVHQLYSGTWKNHRQVEKRWFAMFAYYVLSAVGCSGSGTKPCIQTAFCQLPCIAATKQSPKGAHAAMLSLSSVTAVSKFCSLLLLSLFVVHGRTALATSPRHDTISVQKHCSNITVMAATPVYVSPLSVLC